MSAALREGKGGWNGEEGRRGGRGGGENGQIGWREKDWRSRPWLGKLGLILIKKSKKCNDHPVVSHKKLKKRNCQVLNVSCESCTNGFVAGPTVTCKARPKHQAVSKISVKLTPKNVNIKVPAKAQNKSIRRLYFQYKFRTF